MKRNLDESFIFLRILTNGAQWRLLQPVKYEPKDLNAA